MINKYFINAHFKRYLKYQLDLDIGQEFNLIGIVLGGL
jgi:hypothetical protein